MSLSNIASAFFGQAETVETVIAFDFFVAGVIFIDVEYISVNSLYG